MITAGKDLLSTVITTHTVITASKVARSAAEEMDLKHNRAYPFAALITADGRFDSESARGFVHRDEAAQALVEQLVRGTRILPIDAHFWGESEGAVDAIVHNFLRNIPTQWTFGGFNGSISIVDESHSDHVANVTDAYLISAVVELSVEIGPDATPVPIIGPPVEIADPEVSER